MLNVVNSHFPDGTPIREERINLKCLGLVYTMVNNNHSAKQEKIKENFESKESVNDLDIFNSKTSVVNNIQYGVAGTIPTKYKASYEDIEAISLEIIDKIKTLSEDDE